MLICVFEFQADEILRDYDYGVWPALCRVTDWEHSEDDYHLW